jgi:hypothetical protein
VPKSSDGSTSSLFAAKVVVRGHLRVLRVGFAPNNMVTPFREYHTLKKLVENVFLERDFQQAVAFERKGIQWQT